MAGDRHGYLSNETEAEYRIRGLNAVLGDAARDLERLRRQITNAQARGGFYRKPDAIPGLRKRLRGARQTLVRYRAERACWDGTASPTTARRWHWLHALKRFRWEIETHMNTISSRDNSIAYHEEAIREGWFTEATRRSYARQLESERKTRTEALEQLQQLADADFETYWTWRRDWNGDREPWQPRLHAASSPGPRLRLIAGGKGGP